MQVMADFIDCARLGFYQISGGVKCVCEGFSVESHSVGGRYRNTFFEEEPDLITTVEEVVIADVLAFFTFSGGEFCHGVVVEGEVFQEREGFFEEPFNSLLVQNIGDGEIAVTFKGG